MKTESKLLDLYAEAYKTRSIDKIKDCIHDIIQYTIPQSHPQLMSKNRFLVYLQEKFDGQKEFVSIENECIFIVDNTTTGKENIYIDFGKKREYLISIEVDNGLIKQIKISNIYNYIIKKKKIILTKKIADKLIYLKSGMIVISEEDDPNKVMDIIINSHYLYETCLGVNFNIHYLIKLIKGGFFLMSNYYIHKDHKNLYVMKAMHHLFRSVLFFNHLHIKKSIIKFLAKYELKENVEFDRIVDKCIENHNDHWLTKPLVDAIKEIRRINNPDVSFTSFGLYRDGKLVAGEFGTKVGRIYSSYSGFHEENNSGTVQMILTAQYLEENGYAFWDLGMPINYKKTFGAKVIKLADFIFIWRKYSTSKQNLTERKKDNTEKQSNKLPEGWYLDDYTNLKPK
jgi:Leu/Phe-tRNA-protein transferase